MKEKLAAYQVLPVRCYADEKLRPGYLHLQFKHHVVRLRGEGEDVVPAFLLQREILVPQDSFVVLSKTSDDLHVCLQNHDGLVDFLLIYLDSLEVFWCVCLLTFDTTKAVNCHDGLFT